MPKVTIWIRNEDLNQWNIATKDGASKFIADMLNQRILYTKDNPPEFIDARKIKKESYPTFFKKK